MLVLLHACGCIAIVKPADVAKHMFFCIFVLHWHGHKEHSYTACEKAADERYELSALCAADAASVAQQACRPLCFQDESAEWTLQRLLRDLR